LCKNQLSKSLKVKKGKFIVIEGGVGCGKTTQLGLLKKGLKKGWEFYREPGSTKFGEKVRDAVQGIHAYDVEEYAAMFGYSAARANLIRGLIIPKLKKGINIVLDRYWYSTYAYQGSNGASKKTIELVSKIATNNLKPDLVVFYDLDPKIGMARKGGRKDADRYDIREIDFHKKVRKSYKEIGKKIGRVWKTLDASRPVGEIHGETLKLLKRYNILK
jgi:dTMP kinase